MGDGPTWLPSPNFGPRRSGLTPDLIVLHYTAMQSAEAALERLRDPQAEVSAHYLIGATGRVWQMVEEDQRAWHAGAGCWRGQGDVNSRSIGIELDNTGKTPFAEPQMRALETLLSAVMRRWRIVPVGVIGHSDMAPERKTDPGPRFDWARLAQRGLSVWPDPGARAEGDFMADARAFGYADRFGADAILAAMRARFRPHARGPLCAPDRRVMRNLADRFGVDRNVQNP